MALSKKIIIAAPTLLLACMVMAEDAAPAKLPARIQVIFDKADKKTEEATKEYWKKILAVDKAKLKELEDAMISAAKAGKADEIPVIQKLIVETKEKIEADEAEGGIEQINLSGKTLILMPSKILISLLPNGKTKSQLNDYWGAYAWRQFGTTTIVYTTKFGAKVLTRDKKTHRFNIYLSEGEKEEQFFLLKK